MDKLALLKEATPMKRNRKRTCKHCVYYQMEEAIAELFGDIDDVEYGTCIVETDENKDTTETPIVHATECCSNFKPLVIEAED